MLPQQILILALLFLISTLIQITKAATSLELIELRQKNGYQDCLAGWRQRIHDQCIYPGQSTPCLKNGNDAIARVEEFAENCCKGRCQNLNREKLCCRDKSCLDKCYATIRTHKLRNTQSLEKRTRLMFKTDIKSEENDLLILI